VNVPDDPAVALACHTAAPQSAAADGWLCFAVPNAKPLPDVATDRETSEVPPVITTTVTSSFVCQVSDAVACEVVSAADAAVATPMSDGAVGIRRSR
jgi:hypothetical protein